MSRLSHALMEVEEDTPTALLSDVPIGMENSDCVACVVFSQKDLAMVAFPVMEDIRRMGKLCDVTIKVRQTCFRRLNFEADRKTKRMKTNSVKWRCLGAI